FTYELLDYLDGIQLSEDPNDPLVKYFLGYALPTLVSKFQDQLLSEVPEHHKKAIIACHLAADLVYTKGVEWQPSIADILPVLLKSEMEKSK
ncbi:MAG: hypothetical protein K940chlam7_00736, partial [Chlamydiae bacterium]|nr:hypothetical protein [Chlamydiota bacterium]